MSVIVTPENAQSLLEQELPIVLDFSATWCGPCRKVAPIMDELAEEFEGRVVVAKADVDECEDLAIDFKVRNVPTVLFIKNGERCSIKERLRGKGEGSSRRIILSPQKNEQHGCA